MEGSTITDHWKFKEAFYNLLDIVRENYDNARAAICRALERFDFDGLQPNPPQIIINANHYRGQYDCCCTCCSRQQINKPSHSGEKNHDEESISWRGLYDMIQYQNHALQLRGNDEASEPAGKVSLKPSSNDIEWPLSEVLTGYDSEPFSV
jgi:hypothetical protein